MDNALKLHAAPFLSLLLLSWAIFPGCTSSQTVPASSSKKNFLTVGAAQLPEYRALLKGKRVGLVVNNTSRIGETHLLDTLLAEGIGVSAVFAPEHGIRGNADAGQKVNDSIDTRTGIPIFSLYGKQKKPTTEQLGKVDVMVFDMQDVGARFYTYISTMHYVMESCAENKIPLIVLDRPNPNGDYVDGPVLEKNFTSFVGMHPIPVVHGLTVGELARMINGEGWLKDSVTCELTVIPVANYTHQSPYDLPVKPSPNLPNRQSVRLYPSLCLFEATSISVGRGTYFPFQVLGAPDSLLGKFTFRPESIAGMSSNPPHKDKTCYGIDLRSVPAPSFTLSYFFELQSKSSKSIVTDNRWFDLLMGTDQVRLQIQQGKTEAEIRESWKPALEQYKSIRKKYLLYEE